MLKLEEEMEVLQKNVSDSLDMVSPSYEVQPTNDVRQGDTPTQDGGTYRSVRRSILDQSTNWANLDKKLQANFNFVQSIQEENDRLKAELKELQTRTDQEVQRTRMLEQETIVLSKEKSFYEKMCNDVKAELSQVKDGQCRDITRITEECEAELKNKALEESFKRDLDDTTNRVQSQSFGDNDETFLTTSIVSTNIKDPEQHFKAMDKLRKALTKVVSENKILKSELSVLETTLYMRSRPILGLSAPLSIIRERKRALVESEIQTTEDLDYLSQQSQIMNETVEAMTSKIESLIMREIEMQSTINDLEFKLKCHKKFISGKLA